MLFAPLWARTGVGAGFVTWRAAWLAVALPLVARRPPGPIPLSLRFAIALPVVTRRARPARLLIGLLRRLVSIGRRNFHRHFTRRRVAGGRRRLIARSLAAILVAPMPPMRAPLAMFDAARAPDFDQFRLGGGSSLSRNFGNGLAFTGARDCLLDRRCLGDKFFLNRLAFGQGNFDGRHFDGCRFDRYSFDGYGFNRHGFNRRRFAGCCGMVQFGRFGRRVFGRRFDCDRFLRALLRLTCSFRRFGGNRCRRLRPPLHPVAKRAKDRGKVLA